MKRFVVAIISIYLFVMFLIYIGVFRDSNNPVDAAGYYLECIKDRQGALTYSLCVPGYFNEDRTGTIYAKYNMDMVDRIKFDITNKSDSYATVAVAFIYKDGHTYKTKIRLQAADGTWLVNGLG